MHERVLDIVETDSPSVLTFETSHRRQLPYETVVMLQISAAADLIIDTSDHVTLVLK